MKNISIVLFSVAVAGCVESTISVEESALAMRGVSGTQIDRFHLSSGAIIETPVDLSATPIEAIVDLDSTPRVIAGAGKADGTFAIPGIAPEQPYWLRVGGRRWLTTQLRPRLGIDILGRPDATLATAGTRLALDLDGLVPASAADDFQLTSPNAGLGFFSTASGLNAFAANAPGEGDEALAGALLPFDADPALGSVAAQLVQASRGDELVIAQLAASTPAPGIAVQALARALATSVEMVDGATTTVTGTLAAPPAKRLTLDHPLAAWEALGEDTGGASTLAAASVALSANVLGNVVGSGTPDLVIATFAPGTTPPRLALPYGDPYPAAWPRYITVSSILAVDMAVPGPAGLELVPLTLNMFAQRKLSAGVQNTVPVLSPPLAVTVDGFAPSATALPAVSATPLVAWQPPRTGAPTSYRILIFQLAETAPRFTTVGTLDVDGATLAARIPPGVLPGPGHYAFAVQARIGDAMGRDLAIVNRLPAARAAALGPSVEIR